MTRKDQHKLTVTSDGPRLKGTCACGQWVRTTPDNPGAPERLAARFVDHVTGAHRLD